MSVATLTLRTSGIDPGPLTFAFDTFPSADGYASFQSQHQEEELTSPGVDGKRWRTIFDQIPQLVVEGAWTAVSTHSAACDLADQMRSAMGRQGLLIIVSGGTRSIRLNVHVTAVRPIVNPGVIVGPGVSTGAASVMSTWTFDITETL